MSSVRFCVCMTIECSSSGANGQTALYTPATNTWAAGPDLIRTLGGSPLLFGADDAPAAILPNGHVILAAERSKSSVKSSGTTMAGSAIITGIPSTAQLRVQLGGFRDRNSVRRVHQDHRFHYSGNDVRECNGDKHRNSPDVWRIFSPPTQLFDFDSTTNLIAPIFPPIPRQYPEFHSVIQHQDADAADGPASI